MLNTKFYAKIINLIPILVTRKYNLLYIVVALKSEAQAFIERYKLQKSSLRDYKLFSNEDMKILVSGVGIANARDATQALINTYAIRDKDIYLNVGICGAQSRYDIGSLLSFGSVEYKGIVYRFKEGKKLTCVDKPLSKPSCLAVDMESFGFYDTLIHTHARKNFYILKVVSDHFEPNSVTKDRTKELLLHQISAINNILLSDNKEI